MRGKNGKFEMDEDEILELIKGRATALRRMDADMDRAGYEDEPYHVNLAGDYRDGFVAEIAFKKKRRKK